MTPIKTERLILREVVATDVADMFRLDSDKEVHRYLGEGWMNNSIDDAQKSVDSIISQYKERGIGRWAAIEKSTGNFIGWSGLKLNTEATLNGYSDFYDIGYRLLPQFWGKGYATESSIAALDYGFNILNLKTIYGITHIDNEASHKILFKIGMQLENVFYDKGEKMKMRWYKLDKSKYEKGMS